MLGIADLLKSWTSAPHLSVITSSSGVMNQTFLLKTASADYALRAYRPLLRERIEQEHNLIAYAYEQGLPTLVPLSLADGGTILECEGRFYALFPFAKGHQVKRGELTNIEVAVMGSFLGQLHRALKGYPPGRVQSRPFKFDRAESCAEMEILASVIRARPRLDETDEHLLARLITKRDWLRHAAPVEALDLSQLEYQVIHGDYQETNLFFDRDRVSAIIDWDQSYSAPRAWEIMRVLHLALKFKVDFCQTFLDAYRTVLPLPWSDLELAAACYSEMRAHDTWMYQAIYVEGNDRVRIFAKESTVPFSPFEQWAALREKLS